VQQGAVIAGAFAVGVCEYRVDHRSGVPRRHGVIAGARLARRRHNVVGQLIRVGVAVQRTPTVVDVTVCHQLRQQRGRRRRRLLVEMAVVVTQRRVAARVVVDGAADARRRRSASNRVDGVSQRHRRCRRRRRTGYDIGATNRCECAAGGGGGGRAADDVRRRPTGVALVVDGGAGRVGDGRAAAAAGDRGRPQIVAECGADLAAGQSPRDGEAGARWRRRRWRESARHGAAVRRAGGVLVSGRLAADERSRQDVPSLVLPARVQRVT